MSPTIHATCVVVREAGVLIRGPSGSGKSSLADALIDAAHTAGDFARLVADDRVHLTVGGGRLVATPPAALAGLIERRGEGVLPTPYLAAAVVRLVVDLVGAPERNPPPDAAIATLDGVAVPRLAVAARSELACQHVRAALRKVFSDAICDRSALAFAPQHGKLRSPASHARHLRSVCAGAARGGRDMERNAFCAETA